MRRANARPLTILERYFSGAIVRGERVVAIVRMVIVALFLIEWVFFAGVLGPPYGSPKYWIGIGAFFVGIVYSTWVLLWMREPRWVRSFMIASVSIDALVLTMILVPQVLWAPSRGTGILLAPDLAILMLAIVAAGVRLSRTVMLVGAAEMLALFVFLVALEATASGKVAANPAVTWSFFLLGAALLGYSIATRTRRLVFKGAETALVAERTRQRFGAYVSEEIAREAIEAEEITLGGRRQNVAVLFSDLRGFTGYSERVSPEQLIVELNRYLDAMVVVVRREGGVVDKFIGDAIMVVFGIPKPRSDDALRAVRTAAAMQAALAEHNEQRAAAGRPPFEQGIGVHYGQVIAGHVGNEERLQYTVVGDVVNVASRLESVTKSEGVSVLVSGAVAEAARAAAGEQPELASRGRVELQGHEGDLEVYTFERAEDAAASNA